MVRALVLEVRPQTDGLRVTGSFVEPCVRELHPRHTTSETPEVGPGGRCSDAAEIGASRLGLQVGRVILLSEVTQRAESLGSMPRATAPRETFVTELGAGDIHTQSLELTFPHQNEHFFPFLHGVCIGWLFGGQCRYSQNTLNTF